MFDGSVSSPGISRQKGRSQSFRAGISDADVRKVAANVIHQMGDSPGLGWLTSKDSVEQIQQIVRAAGPIEPVRQMELPPYERDVIPVGDIFICNSRAWRLLHDRTAHNEMPSMMSPRVVIDRVTGEEIWTKGAFAVDGAATWKSYLQQVEDILVKSLSELPALTPLAPMRQSLIPLSGSMSRHQVSVPLSRYTEKDTDGAILDTGIHFVVDDVYGRKGGVLIHVIHDRIWANKTLRHAPAVADILFELGYDFLLVACVSLDKADHPELGRVIQPESLDLAMHVSSAITRLTTDRRIRKFADSIAQRDAPEGNPLLGRNSRSDECGVCPYSLTCGSFLDDAGDKVAGIHPDDAFHRIDF